MPRPFLAISAQRPRRWVPPSALSPSANHPIVLIRPPYEPSDLQSVGAELLEAADVPGTVVGVQIHRRDIDLHALQTLIRDLSQRVPSSPVVVVVKAPAEDALLVSARLAALQLRAVVPQGPLMRPLLREALTNPAALPRDVTRWLQIRGARLNPNVAELLERLFRDATEHTRVSSLLEAHRIPPSSARHRLRKKGLPPPGRWLQLARATHVALRLQARPDASLREVAEEMGFADHSAAAHLLRRSLGVGAREVRGTLGWEWLLDRRLTPSPGPGP